MADDSKIEIELAIRESVSTAFQTIGREMAKFNRQAQETASAGSGLRNVDGLLSGMGKSLLGPLGIAAGFIAAAKSLDTFAISQLQIRNFARDTGFSTEQVSKLRAQFAVAGVDINRATTAIGGFGQRVQDAASIPFGSDMVRQLNMFNPELARTVQHFASTGDQVKVLDAIHAAYVNSSVARQNLISKAVGLTRTEILAHGMDIRGLVRAWDYPEGSVQKYHKGMLNLETSLSNIWKDISFHAIEEIEKINGGWNSMDETARSVADKIKKFMTFNIFPTLSTTVQEFRTIVDYLNKIEAFINKHIGGEEKDGDLLGKFGPGRAIERIKTVNENLKSPDFVPLPRPRPRGSYSPESSAPAIAPFDRLMNWLKGSNEEDSSIPSKAKPSAYHPVGKELVDVENDSNAVLRDMRDIMQRMETGGGGGGSGGTTFRRGIGTGRGGGGGGGGGGEDTGYGGGDTSLVGNEFLASQRARFKKELDENPELRLRAAAITSLENEGAKTGVMESAMNRGAMTGRSLESILSGGPNSFYGPARRPGMVEARMEMLRRNQKHYERLNRLTDAALAGSNLIEGHTDQGSAGDPNYEKGGLGININRERFNDWGGYRGVAASRRFREAQQAQVRKSRDEAAARAATFNDRFFTSFPAGGRNLNERALLDSSLAKAAGSGPVGSLNAEIDFKNVPPGVRTSAEGSGFKLLKVTATKQAMRAGEGMLYPTDSNYTPYVP